MVQVKKVPINDIHPNDYNPNVIIDRKFQALVQNINDEGEMYQPILLNKDLTIIDGEQRWKASQEAGLTEIYAVIIETTEEQAKLKTIAFNNLKGDFDPLKLNELLTELLDGFDMEDLSKTLGIDTHKLERLTIDLEKQIDDTDFDVFKTDGEDDRVDLMTQRREYEGLKTDKIDFNVNPDKKDSDLDISIKEKAEYLIECPFCHKKFKH